MIQDEKNPLDINLTEETRQIFERTIELVDRWYRNAEWEREAVAKNGLEGFPYDQEMAHIERELNAIYNSNNPVIAFMRQRTESELKKIAEVFGRRKDEEEYAHNEH